MVVVTSMIILQISIFSSSLKRLLWFSRLYSSLPQDADRVYNRRYYHPLMHHYDLMPQSIHKFIDNYITVLNTPVDSDYYKMTDAFIKQYEEFNDPNIDYTAFYMFTTHLIQNMLVRWVFSWKYDFTYFFLFLHNFVT